MTTLTASPVMPHSQQAAEQFCGIDLTSCWPALTTWTLKWSYRKKCPKAWIMPFLRASWGPTSWERRGSGGGWMAGCFMALRLEPSLFFYYYFQFLLLSLLNPSSEYLIKFSTGSPPLLILVECLDHIVRCWTTSKKWCKFRWEHNVWTVSHLAAWCHSGVTVTTLAPFNALIFGRYHTERSSLIVKVT